MATNSEAAARTAAHENLPSHSLPRPATGASTTLVCARHRAMQRRAEAAYLAGLVALNERRIVRGRRGRAAVAQAIAECGACAEGGL